MTKVMAFGAGNFYLDRKEAIKREYEIVAFLDNDTRKIGKVFDGRKIFSPEEISYYQDMKILITSSYRFEIIDQLMEMGIKEERILCVFPEWMKECDSVPNVVCGGGGKNMFTWNFRGFA